MPRSGPRLAFLPPASSERDARAGPDRGHPYADGCEIHDCATLTLLNDSTPIVSIHVFLHHHETASLLVCHAAAGHQWRDQHGHRVKRHPVSISSA